MTSLSLTISAHDFIAMLKILEIDYTILPFEHLRLIDFTVLRNVYSMCISIPNARIYPAFQRIILSFKADSWLLRILSNSRFYPV